MKRSDSNPLSQNTTAHITTVTMDDVICLGHRSHRAFFVSVRTSVDCYPRILLNTVLPSRINDGELEMDILRQKSSIYFIFDAVSCYLMQV